MTLLPFERGMFAVS